MLKLLTLWSGIRTLEEKLVLFFQWQSESVDDGSQYFEQFGNTVEALGFINELEEDVVDGSSNERTKVQELAIDPMKGGLQEIPLPWILRVEKLKQLQDEMVVDVLLGVVGIEILAFNEAQKELVDNLNMWPGNLEDRLILFWVKGLTLRVDRRWNWSEEILAEHFDNSWVHWLCNDLSVLRDIVQQLVECQSLDFL